MANRFPAFQFYPKEWLSSTARRTMTLEAQGAYFNLLCHYWEGQCKGLPADPKKLARLAEIPGTEDDATATISQIISSSFYEKQGVIHNKRLRTVYLELVKYSTQAAKAGKAGAKKRWGGHRSANSGTVANDSSSSPISSLLSPVSDLRTPISEGGIPPEAPTVPTGKTAGEGPKEERDPATEIDYAPIERILEPFPSRVRSAALRFAGFIANGFTTQSSLEESIRTMLNRYESFKMEPGPWEKFFEKGVDQAIKYKAKSVEYALKAMNTAMFDWRESRAR